MAGLWALLTWGIVLTSSSLVGESSLQVKAQIPTLPEVEMNVHLSHNYPHVWMERRRRVLEYIHNP
jgi:hypothetical protein